MPIIIHNKPYNTVAERIEKAGDNLVGVKTKVLNNNPVVIKAIITVLKERKVTKELPLTKVKCIFTGISAADPNKQIEKENPYEVAETSALGRALAFAGYETTNGIASAEEMKKATRIEDGRIIEPVEDRMEFKDSQCQHCGADIIISKSTGKPFCKNKCWLPENLHFRNEYKKT